jgi:hypothetical protein
MALNASIDLTVNKPDFKSMKAEIRELTVAAQQAVMQFGEFSPEAIKAEKALAQARDRMEDFNDRVKAVNPDKFAQLNTVVSGVARGFQAAQGAMASIRQPKRKNWRRQWSSCKERWHWLKVLKDSERFNNNLGRLQRTSKVV